MRRRRTIPNGFDSYIQKRAAQRDSRCGDRADTGAAVLRPYMFLCAGTTYMCGRKLLLEDPGAGFFGEAAAVAGELGVLPFGAHDFGCADGNGGVGEADFNDGADVDVDVAGAEEAVLADVFGHGEDVEVGAVGGLAG